MLSKERFALVWVTTLVVVLGLYFAAVTLTHYTHPDLSLLARIGMLAVALGTLGMIALGAWLYGRWRDRGEIAEDERDRFIEQRSSKIAYYVLLAGIIYTGMVMPFTHGGWEIVHAALFFVAVAEIVHGALILMGYRRGWHA
ncbi:MAG: DUF2178 domain-containing protein [Proteobacteria bacterium]|nr:DUF2178 domain-containing protein [Pseudomonadota bacterium]